MQYHSGSVINWSNEERERKEKKKRQKMRTRERNKKKGRQTDIQTVPVTDVLSALVR